MAVPTLFVHIDTALRAIAMIVLCALPALIPLPVSRRALTPRALASAAAPDHASTD